MSRALSSKLEAVHESTLVRRAKAGDRHAFDELVRAHFRGVYSLLFRLVGNHEDAEDLAQECFIRAHRSLAFYRSEGTLRAWLSRIALHLARDHHRDRGRGVLVLAMEEARHEPTCPSPEPPAELSARELTRLVDQAVGELPHNLRAALVLRVLEGLEYEQVAEIIGVKVGTARTQVMKARRTLARSLGPWLRGGHR